MNCLPKHQAAISFVFFLHVSMCKCVCYSDCLQTETALSDDRTSADMTKTHASSVSALPGVTVVEEVGQGWRDFTWAIVYYNHFYFEEFFYWLFAGL